MKHKDIKEEIMYYRRVIIMIVTVFTLLFAFSANASASKDYLERAKKSADMGMLEQAIKLCKEELYEDPENAEAHYVLGVLYLDQIQQEIKTDTAISYIVTNVREVYKEAVSRFQAAIKLESGYRGKVNDIIISFYRDAMRGKHDPGSRKVKVIVDYVAKGLYNLGMSREEVVDMFWEKGEEYFQKSNYGAGNAFFHLVCQKIDGQRWEEVAQLYADYASKADDIDAKIFLLSRARQLDRSFKKQYGEVLWQKSKQIKDESRRKKFVSKAAEYDVPEAQLEQYAEKYNHEAYTVPVTKTWGTPLALEKNSFLHYYSKHDIVAKIGKEGETFVIPAGEQFLKYSFEDVDEDTTLYLRAKEGEKFKFKCWLIVDK